MQLVTTLMVALSVHVKLDTVETDLLVKVKSINLSIAQDIVLVKLIRCTMLKNSSSHYFEQ
jgi:hypothetical protein